MKAEACINTKDTISYYWGKQYQVSRPLNPNIRTQPQYHLCHQIKIRGWKYLQNQLRWSDKTWKRRPCTGEQLSKSFQKLLHLPCKC